MIRTLFMLPLLLGTAAIASELPAFEQSAEVFADAAACRLHLTDVVAAARAEQADVAEGPYAFAAEDHRAHVARRQRAGHRISEYRCEAERLSQRSWARGTEGDEEPFTVESVTRNAEWLKK
jgi:hypothetical protein